MNELVAKTASALNEWSEEQTKLIKEQIAPKATDGELMLFAEVCKRTGLDPFSKQIYAIHRWDSKEQKNKMSIQASIDGYRLIAYRAGKYDGSQTFWCGKDKVWQEVWLDDTEPLAAKTVVKKKGSQEEFVGIATMKSYKPKGANQSFMWSNMPDAMLGKCSEALALRKAFPSELSGIYTAEELQNVEQEPVSVEKTNSAEQNAINILKATKVIKEQEHTAEGEIIQPTVEESEDFKKFAHNIATCNNLADLKAIRAEGKDGKLTESERKVLGERYKHKVADLEAMQSEW